jgi:23S rRNA (guanosine2251-2'-O)-methyltransferase
LQFKYLSLDELILKTGAEENSVVIILDEITDPRNLGAIIRSAAAFSVSGIIIPERNSAHPNETVASVSVGTEVFVPIIKVKNIVRAIEKLKEEKFWIYGADMNGEDIRDVSFDKKTVLIMGSEGRGMRRLTEESLDFKVKIKMKEGVESLNVASAASILLYEIKR